MVIKKKALFQIRRKDILGTRKSKQTIARKTEKSKTRSVRAFIISAHVKLKAKKNDNKFVLATRKRKESFDNSSRDYFCYAQKVLLYGNPRLPLTV